MQLSVIVPTYNSEDYILDTLEQVYKLSKLVEMELIVVDDGSRDSTTQLIKKYENKMSLKIIYNSHYGVGYARNTGILYAVGKYITFVDSDDLIIPEAYKAAIVSAEKASYPDIVSCSKHLSGNRLVKGSFKKSIFLADMYISTKNFDILQYSSGPYSKLFCREFLLNQGIKFPVDINNGEDLIFNGYAILCARSILLISITAYLYRKHEGSLMTSANEKLIENNAKLLEEVKKLLGRAFEGKNGEYYSYWILRVMLINIVRVLCSQRRGYKEQYKAATKKICSASRDRNVRKIFNSSLSTRQKLLIFVIRFTPKWFSRNAIFFANKLLDSRKNAAGVFEEL